MPTTEISQDLTPLVTGHLLTVDEVANYLRLTPETVRAMARRGELPAMKLGRVWRFRQQALEQHLEEGLAAE